MLNSLGLHIEMTMQGLISSVVLRRSCNLSLHDNEKA